MSGSTRENSGVLKDDPLKHLTDRIKAQCLRRVKEGRREALAALRRRKAGQESIPTVEGGVEGADPAVRALLHFFVAHASRKPASRLTCCA